jgi:hypothetical protein
MPDREDPLLEAAVTVTKPEPVPELPLVILRKLLLLEAFQPQPVPSELSTENVVVPPLAATDAVNGVTSNPQPAAS